MADVVLDCKGMVCPMPIAKAQQKARDMKPGQTLEVIADCSSFPTDVKEWCQKTNHPLISLTQNGPICNAVIKF